MSSRYKLSERPSDDAQRATFDSVYRHIVAIDLPWDVKYAGFERILYDCKRIDHWRPVGISHDALKVLAEQGFPNTCKELVRGHILGRRERAKMILDVDTPLPDAWEIFTEHDKVVIITKSENSTQRTADTWSEIYPIPPDLFDYVEGFGLHYGKGMRREFFESLAKGVGVLAHT